MWFLSMQSHWVLISWRQLLALYMLLVADELDGGQSPSNPDGVGGACGGAQAGSYSHDCRKWVVYFFCGYPIQLPLPFKKTVSRDNLPSVLIRETMSWRKNMNYRGQERHNNHAESWGRERWTMKKKINMRGKKTRAGEINKKVKESQRLLGIRRECRM